ncbi:MAG TPA: cyclic nucleotide-binding domain-containing protein [Thermoanaerobaculia bacterium]|nr:cyclic nucleotide-binding domain-containing protein [Thermoanaerobaculia bacterium]
METLDPLLAEHPFLSGLTPPQIATVAGCARNERFEAGQFLFHEGEEANHFFIIRHGKVAVDVAAPPRGGITIQTVADGEILGWSWLVPPYRWRFSAQAKELTRTIALDARCLRQKCEEDHELGYELLKRFADVVGQRLDATRIQLLDVYAAEPAGRHR